MTDHADICRKKISYENVEHIETNWVSAHFIINIIIKVGANILKLFSAILRQDQNNYKLLVRELFQQTSLLYHLWVATKDWPINDYTINGTARILYYHWSQKAPQKGYTKFIHQFSNIEIDTSSYNLSFLTITKCFCHFINIKSWQPLLFSSFLSFGIFSLFTFSELHSIGFY